MRIAPFSVARLPRIVFGAGVRRQIPQEVAAFGRRVLIVTGRAALRGAPAWTELLEGLDAAGLGRRDLTVDGEPSPDLVDAAIARHRGDGIDVVLGIGGGSALDAAKAIAGLLRTGTSVMDHLEGVGRNVPYAGPAVPLVAVPTTAGTGSEATKNAVLSRHGADGFKKSFRDEQLVARVAVVDPDFLATCPRPVLAANGMDAFTQLLESYVSVNASPFTDALAWSGMQAFRDGFFAAYEGAGEAATAGRGCTAYAALLSGITLAQAGLGSVHGLASPLGGFFPVPHGVVCGTLVAEATAINLRALQAREPGHPALAKYARVGELLGGDDGGPTDDAPLETLVEALRAWTARLDLPRLGTFGMTADDVPRVVAGSRGGSMKTNPLVLTDEDLAELLTRRL